MARFEVSTNQGQMRNKLGQFQKKIDTFRDELLEGITDQLIRTSPVDTGTYITSHRFDRIGATGTTSSRGKPRKQLRGPFEIEGASLLRSSAASLPETSKRIVVTNISEHADKVEILYGTYAGLRREIDRIAREAKNAI